MELNLEVVLLDTLAPLRQIAPLDTAWKAFLASTNAESLENPQLNGTLVREFLTYAGTAAHSATFKVLENSSAVADLPEQVPFIPDAETPAWQELARKLQQNSAAMRKAWKAWCKRFTEDHILDPSKYDGLFLARFIAFVGSTTLFAISRDGKDGGPKIKTKSSYDPGIIELAERVEVLREKSADLKKSWEEYCISRPNSQMTPAEANSEQLQGWLETVQDMEGREELKEARKRARERAELAGRIETMRRSSPALRKAWREHCKLNFDGIANPVFRTTSELQEWIKSATENKAQTRAQMLETEELVEKVKMCTRGSEKLNAAWNEYCNTHHGSNKDPTVRSKADLEGWLQSVEAEVDDAVTRAQLILQVKELQKMYPQITRIWHEYCDKNHQGDKLPGSRTTEELMAFLDVAVGEGSEAQQDAEKTQLVLKVKAVTKAGLELYQSWGRLCQLKYGGVLDPSLRTSAELNEWLDSLGEAVEVAVRRASVLDQVKDLKRRSAEVTQAWVRYCDRNHKGKKAPGYRTTEELLLWLDSVAHLAVDLEDDEPEFAPIELVKEMKAKLRKNPDMQNAWNKWCRDNYEGMVDPAFRTEWELQEFLDLVS